MRVVIWLIVLDICASYLMPKLRFSRNSLSLSFMKTCFPSDPRKKKNVIHSLEEEIHKPFYTLIWYDCPKCKELILQMEFLNLKYTYVNGGIYFYDITDELSEFNNPVLYKDDIVIGDNLFDIYEEIYKLV